MRIIPIPLFTDNYCYAVFTHLLNSYLLVDPAHFSAVTQFVSSHPDLQSRRLTHVLSTHKHGDHSGDNESIAKSVPGVVILGGREDNVPACSFPVDEKTELRLENGIRIQVLNTPCHTRGHVVYYLTDEQEVGHKAMFTGDTLFIGGCGRFFEGSASEMQQAFSKIRSLPLDTEIYCGHEYTLANLEWAAQVDPRNTALQAKLAWTQRMRSEGIPTVPSLLGEELTYNVFLRANELMEVVGTTDPVTALQELRRWKNEGKVANL